MEDAHRSQLSLAGVRVVFATPRKLPRPSELSGRVAVVDIAFASQSGGKHNEFERTTLRFIDALGDRLAAWVDHHDSAHHARFSGDPRFVLTTKAEHGACPELITPAVVERAGPIGSIVCHTDFDGLASAAKWLNGGIEPYPGSDDDARRIDTRKGLPSAIGARIDRALRARTRDESVMRAVVELFHAGLAAPAQWQLIDSVAAELVAKEQQAERLAEHFERAAPELVLIDVARAGRTAAYDKTWLLLLGQARAPMAVVIDGDTATFAAPYDSGVDFLARFGLSGGMPTMVSIHHAHLADALVALGSDVDIVKRYR
jgi:hypothetical protein